MRERKRLSGPFDMGRPLSSMEGVGEAPKDTRTWLFLDGFLVVAARDCRMPRAGPGSPMAISDGVRRSCAAGPGPPVVPGCRFQADRPQSRRGVRAAGGERGPDRKSGV